MRAKRREARRAAKAAQAKAAAAARALEAAATKYFPVNYDAAVMSKLPAKRIFRLTRDQLDASAAALLPAYVKQSVKSYMSKDPLQTNYEYAELLSFNTANISGVSKWIGDIAAGVKKKPAGVIACPGGGQSPACLRQQARQFVMKAFRGDVNSAKVDKIVAFYLAGVKSVGFAQATSELVEVTLNSPHFLFRKEVDADERRRLAPPQLLQTLTYTMADVPPDQLKLQSQNAARYLASAIDTNATIDKILKSKEARAKVKRFFKAWLEIREPEEFKISKTVFPEFNKNLAVAMLDETDRFLGAHLSQPRPSLKDITQTTQTYVPKGLANIYKIPVSGNKRGIVADLNPAQRLGIFSQPALLASHSGPTDTRLIKRGVFWARKVMCMPLEPPPPGIDSSLKATGFTTERSRVAQSTKRRACAGCHNIINPFGFFQENYDALGRWRTHDEKGYQLDAGIVYDFLDEGRTKANTPVEALRSFTNSVKFKQCFVRQLFRFYLGRNEEPADNTLLRQMFLNFARDDKQDIMGAIKTLATSERIAMRE